MKLRFSEIPREGYTQITPLLVINGIKFYSINIPIEPVTVVEKTTHVFGGEK